MQPHTQGKSSEEDGGGDETKKKIAEKIGPVFDVAINRKPKENVAAEEAYATICDVGADRVQAAAGLDVRGYSHFISGHEILHALRRHEGGSGDPRPVAKENFVNIHEIITTAVAHDVFITRVDRRSAGRLPWR